VVAHALLQDDVGLDFVQRDMPRSFHHHLTAHPAAFLGPQAMTAIREIGRRLDAWFGDNSRRRFGRWLNARSGIRIRIWFNDWCRLPDWFGLNERSWLSQRVGFGEWPRRRSWLPSIPSCATSHRQNHQRDCENADHVESSAAAPQTLIFQGAAHGSASSGFSSTVWVIPPAVTEILRQEPHFQFSNTLTCAAAGTPRTCQAFRHLKT
jgi:hypothetical protein